MTTCWHQGLPDSETTVLMRVDDEAYPVWPGFHDGECWRNADATRADAKVLGWMPLERAAEILDAK